MGPYSDVVKVEGGGELLQKHCVTAICKVNESSAGGFRSIAFSE